MRRAAIVITSAVGGALVMPAGPMAAEEPPPSAVVEASATQVVAGAPVRLDSSRSSGAIVGHQWDLDGNGSFETDTGSLAVAEATPDQPGTLTLRVRVVDASGQAGEAAVDVTVSAPPAPEPEPVAPEPAEPAATAGESSAEPAAPAEPAAAPAEPAERGPTSEPEPQPEAAPAEPAAQAPAPAPARPKQRAAKDKAPATQVRAAASTSVPIKNFKYIPASVTVSVGDTITWTNQDQAPHTSTANDGSFDTGNLNKGESGSHTFTKAGTFPYICALHPNMKATVVVTGASAGSSGGGSDDGGADTGSATPSDPSASAAAAPSSGGLPQTGLNLLPVVLLAALMTASGTALRRLVA
jgi:plastocyanin